MKTFLKLILQRIFGFRNYLYIFSLFIIKKLRWDKHEKDFLYFLNLLPAEGTVLDIGANLGVMTCYLAKGFQAREVYSFEPIPYNFDNLLKIKRKYRLENVNALQLALGDKEGELEMVLPVEKSVRFHGLAHVKNEQYEMNSGEIFRCPVKKLDDIDELQDKNITGIKIDVENYEYYVLKGADKLLKKNFPIIYCELWDNENRKLTMDLLQEIGYSIFVLAGKNLVPFQPEIHNTQNFFFVKE